MFNKIFYSELNSRQKETYNYQKVSGLLADYGYTTIKLSDDRLGADFIAMHFNGNQFLRIQLKSRLTFNKKYLNKNLYICFEDKKQKTWYLYNHDKLLAEIKTSIGNTKSWGSVGSYSWNNISKINQKLLDKYKIN